MKPKNPFSPLPTLSSSSHAADAFALKHQMGSRWGQGDSVLPSLMGLFLGICLQAQEGEYLFNQMQGKDMKSL